MTPLMFAAQNGHANAVKALLNSGADRCTEVRMIPCPLMTAHQIMLFNGVLLYLAISVVVFCALVVIVMYSAESSCLLRFGAPWLRHILRLFRIRMVGPR